MLLLICLLALAQEAPSLLDQAGDRIEDRDFPGARILLDQAMARGDVDTDRALYLLGMSWEFAGRPDAALPLYDEGLRLYPTGPHTQDRWFRKAEALDTLGQSAQALDWIDRIDARNLQGLARRKFDLVRAIMLLRTGKRRKGLRAVAKAMEALAPTELTFYQAKARVVVARSDADRAAKRWDLRGTTRVQRGHLLKRARLISELERQGVVVAELDEPEWLLAIVLVLAEAYATLADDLEAHPRPSLEPAQLAIYDAEIRKRVETLRIKALRTCDVALDMVARIGWRSSRVDDLQSLKTALERAIDG